MIKLFNLDLHISVIEDLKYILKDIYNDKIEITDWSLSGHSWIFNKNIENVKIINQNTWKSINENMIEDFILEYYNFLVEFDGFIVTHTPIFSLLYEKFNKPIILINSTRYEQPLSWNNNLNMWEKFNTKLKYMYDRKQLIAISNNKGDAEYLKIGTGIESIIIPSLCLYTEIKYQVNLNNENNENKNFNKFINYSSSYINESEYIINKNNIKQPYKWYELYSYNGIIHIPYEISTMSIFEQYSANVPLFFPSKNLLKSMIKNNEVKMNCLYHKLFGNCSYLEKMDSCLGEDKWIDFWIDKADYYDEENMKYIIYFNSKDELNEIIKNIDIDEINKISLKMDIHNQNRKKLVYEKWENIIDSLFYHKIFTRYIITEDCGNMLELVATKEQIIPECCENNGKKVISYSLWGNNPTYNIGAIKNAVMAIEFYPEFECWFYIHRESVLNETINTLEKMKHVKIIFKTGNLDNEICKPRTWRYEAIDCDEVSVMMPRDTDSRFTLREKLGVDEWLKSDKTFHIMRDHPHHNFVILGGMFGTRKIKSFQNWTNAINIFNQTDIRMYDQDFLRDIIYPLIKNDSIIHATFNKYENELCKDFPIGYDDSYKFVGEYIYADESRSLNHVEALKNAI
jgi:hypothetical protein